MPGWESNYDLWVRRTMLTKLSHASWAEPSEHVGCAACMWLVILQVPAPCHLLAEVSLAPLFRPLSQSPTRSICLHPIMLGTASVSTLAALRVCMWLRSSAR